MFKNNTQPVQDLGHRACPTIMSRVLHLLGDKLWRRCCDAVCYSVLIITNYNEVVCCPIDSLRRDVLMFGSIMVCSPSIFLNSLLDMLNSCKKLRERAKVPGSVVSIPFTAVLGPLDAYNMEGIRFSKLLRQINMILVADSCGAGVWGSGWGHQ